MDTLTYLLSGLALTWVGVVEWRIRNMSVVLSKTISRPETQDLIDLNKQALEVRDIDLQKDMQRVEKKLDDIEVLLRKLIK